MKITLRDYQQRSVDEIRYAMQCGHRSVLFVLPTGGGKTVIFSYITESAAIKGNRVLILVHRQELVEQTSSTLANIGVDHGIIANGWKQDLSHGVQVASVATLARRLHRFDPNFFQLVVIDEAHHAVAGTWEAVLAHFGDAKQLGVTATPERLDGHGLGNMFSIMIEGPQVLELEQAGHIVPAKYFGHPDHIEAVLPKKGDEFDLDALEEEALTRKALDSPVEQYKARLDGQTAVAFCLTVAHAEMLADSFCMAGIPSVVLDGRLSKTVRRQRLQALAEGKIKIITSCMVISEGFDLPSVGGCILVRPTMSLALHLQQIGRCLRPAPGKTHATILDMVGNTKRHGFHIMEREWSLEDQERKEKLSVKQCPDCYAILPISTTVCKEWDNVKNQECGHVFGNGPQELKPLEEAGDVIVVELDQSQIRLKRRSEELEADTLEALQELGRQRGYKPGWAYYRHKARQIKRGSRSTTHQADSWSRP
tara:strand:- start:819 stop:2261 length:1443 start_codon:yes stop_codon:yes gene_type:complete